MGKKKLKPTMYAIWCEGKKWYGDDETIALWKTRSEAQDFAAEEYGYRDYKTARDEGWVEVVPVTVVAVQRAAPTGRTARG